ncbi:FAD-dependent oxidoreductase [Azospirillum picis]|uniref:3-(3-hydroxy-phenyl)propionate hydroxylase n=1 Tax=Azospirillum picis TaxID=488438 RepID=A0ABU0MTA5_9PROT|nr:FAD-dependent oxidoreductase [Azospirillum picis]MBP2302957.1 3-(3-hydroxy-phenyl)propionate hydroxylase [Azospirillum picis]MDQ0536709.1 3-(3-hydroxy-phenyl)propionate hydroxylase [Azospirillum picis]
MDRDYQTLVLDYRRCDDQAAAVPARHPVVVVGAGPVGLATAIDLAQRGLRVLLLDDDDRLSVGSRGLCYSKRTLEIFDRLGCGQRIVDKGISWNVGKVFFQDALAYRFDLLPEAGHRRPAFINLQQYYLEGYLHDHAAALETLDIRWRNRLVGLERLEDGVELTVDTPDGAYRLRCDWLIACDGARSPTRALMGLESKGRVFRDRFLIADVRMTADFPTERWFWFDPPFHRNQSVLLHRQADDVWRIDFQLGWDADPEEEKKPEKVIPRIRALLGEEREFTLDWVSVYTFACRRMERFRHGRVIFAGDSAHGVSPFGARGANSGIQDADNLAWKLALVLEGKAPDRLLDSYASEREFAADENILNSTRSTDFITPKSPVSRTFRDAVLSLAGDCAFARRLVNSGRLSVPSVLADSPLNTPDGDAFAGPMVPGAPAADAPVRRGGAADWFLAHVGQQFTAVFFTGGEPLAAETASALAGLAAGPIPVRAVLVVPAGATAAAAPGLTVLEDAEGLLALRYDARPGTVHLLRPDQHVCARWRSFDAGRLRAAVATATCTA